MNSESFRSELAGEECPLSPALSSFALHTRTRLLSTLCSNCSFPRFFALKGKRLAALAPVGVLVLFCNLIRT